MAVKRKLTYKITNWKQYNESLVQRGNITVWFSEALLTTGSMRTNTSKVGRPFTYSDTASECLLTIRELFKLPYRQTEGFGRSMIKLLEVDVVIPDYSSLAKRAAKLGVALKVANKQGAIDIVVDSTGLKVFGEGEWKIRTARRSGGVFGMSSQVLLFPDQNFAVVLLANDGGLNTQGQLETIALTVVGVIKQGK